MSWLSIVGLVLLFLATIATILVKRSERRQKQ